MRYIKQYYEYGLVGIIGIIVFFLTKRNNSDLDMYFHIKAGEVFLQKGILFHDIFSYTAEGRQWIPYEWLFQIGIYQLVHWFTLSAIGPTVAILSTFQIILLYIFLKKLYKPPVFLLLLLISIYTLGIFFFLVPRPTILANICFLVVAYVILLYVYKKKNYLWITLPVYLLWINMHASFIVAIGMAGYYAFILRSKVLSIYTCVFLILSFSPPLWGSQYEVLLQFLQRHDVLVYVTEWRPLLFDLTTFWLYTSLIAILAGLVLFVWRKVPRKEFLYLFPMAILAISAYIANRNLLYGFFGIAAIGAWIMQFLDTKIYRVCYISSILLFLGVFSIAMRNTLLNPSTYSFYAPEKATSFIYTEHVQGNIFNDYNYGGYLLYRLYPQQKVFIDGRTDVYLCCELPVIQKLDSPAILNNKQQYYQEFSSVLQRYHISIILVERTGMAPAEISYLYTDTRWSLIFWDDNGLVFVRKNDVNNEIIHKFGVTWLTPLADNSFNTHHLKEAEMETRKMIGIADSSISRDILGQILVQEGKNIEAIEQFQKALALNPSYLPAYQHLLLLQQQ